MKSLRLNIIYASLLVACFPAQTWANHTNESTQDNQQAQTLQDVKITAKRWKTRKDNEVTGLGKLVKNTDTINKEQVLNIRDLTRYDPGISVVEQGRGASSGYSIRGMDRNRVAINVDGLPQAQSYTVYRSRAGGGAINEVEYENVRTIEISKGASSSEYGNGAIGGAVAFQSKQASDVIKHGQNWGLNTKNAYQSRNGQLVNSAAFAGKMDNGLEALAIVTDRRGKETQVHHDAGYEQYRITRLGGYLNRYQMTQPPWIHTPMTPDALTRRGWFLIPSECPSLNCEPKAPLVEHRPIPYTERTDPPYTINEQEQNRQSTAKAEIISAKDYAGEQRILPNPMEYRSRSWLFRPGFHITPRHYVGAIMEYTKQHYDIHDMTVQSFYSIYDRDKSRPMQFVPEGYGGIGTGVYEGNNLYSGLYHGNIGARYSRTQYIDEHHRKMRKGLEYRYDNPDKDSWLDHASIQFDRQDITLDTHLHKHNCVDYPSTDHNCRASEEKPWSAYSSEHNQYREQHNLFQAAFDKSIHIGASKHQFSAGLGFDKFRSILQRSDYFDEVAQSAWLRLSGTGTYNDPYIYRRENRGIRTTNYCDYSGVSADLSDCTPRVITGHNHYFSLRDNMSLGKYIDFGLGGRYDYYKMHSDDYWTAGGKYRKFSWNSGIVIKPTEHIALSYRVSNGFRVPSFYELFGIRYDGQTRCLYDKNKHACSDDFHYVGKFTTEKAFNQEFGLSLNGNWGTLETSYFYNNYRDLITKARESGLKHNTLGYHNIQDVKLVGVNVIGKIDWNGVWSKIPDGLYSTLAYSKIKAKDRKSQPGYTDITDPVLDAVQPARYIFSLGYDHPEGKWGVNTILTYSKGKNNDELIGRNLTGFVRKDIRISRKRTHSWYTWDLAGYINLKKYFTLRAGIYNLMNYRYTTWEAVRQSAVGSVNQHNTANFERYAAPGRNFAVSLEMKF